MRAHVLILPLYLSLAHAQDAGDDVLALLREGQSVRARDLAAATLQSLPASSTPANRAAWHQVLGAAHNQLNQYADAEAVLFQGIKVLQSLEHSAPHVAVSLRASLAETLLHSNRPREAESLLQDAFRIAAEHLPPGHARHAVLWDTLGLVQFTRGDHRRAETSWRRAYEILANSLGASHPDTIAQASSLATALVAMNRNEEAYTLAWQARRQIEAKLGAHHQDTIRASYAAAITLLHSEPARAEAILRDALLHWQRASHQQIHPTVAMILAAIASARNRQNDRNGAVEFNARSLDILRQLVGPNHQAVVQKMYDHAQLLRSAKRGKEAAAMQKDADRIREAHGYPPPSRQTVDIRSLRPNNQQTGQRP